MASGPPRRRATDRQILNILYRRYCRRLKLRLQRFFRNPQDANDCVHEAYTRAGERGELADIRWLRAYINRIVRNLRSEVIRIGRRERDVLTVSSELADYAAEHPVDLSPEMTEAEFELDLIAMIQHLPDRRGRVFRLSLEGYSYREIALQLGISVAAVGQDLMHARQELEEMLIPRGGTADEEKD